MYIFLIFTSSVAKRVVPFHRIFRVGRQLGRGCVCNPFFFFSFSTFFFFLNYTKPVEFVDLSSGYGKAALFFFFFLCCLPFLLLSSMARNNLKKKMSFNAPFTTLLPPSSLSTLP